MRISELLFKYLHGSIDAEESARLQDWKSASSTSERLYNELTDRESLQSKFAVYAEQKDRSLSELKKVMASDMPSGRVYSLRARWLRYAAVLLLLAGAGSYYLYHRSFQHQAIVAARSDTTRPIKPGSHKARLTLADGRVIELDGGTGGELTRQGSTRIIQSGNGPLVYEPGKGSQALIYNTISTPRGGAYQVVLPDGSKVWLNAESSVRFPAAFTGNERTLEITGEVYIEAGADMHRPFSVKAGATVVEVLGTQFNINAYPDEQVLKTTLIGGKVRILYNGQQVVLDPGKQAYYTEAKKLVVQPVNTDAVVAWKNGYFRFEGADTRSIMRQLARWYDVEIEYAGAVPNNQFDGSIPRDTRMDDIIKILAASKIRVHRDGRRLIVMP